MSVTVREIAAWVNGSVIGNPDTIISKPNTIEDATDSEITFYANPKYEEYLLQSKAGAILVEKSFKPSEKITPTLIVVDDIRKAMAELQNIFSKKNEKKSGISPNAIVDKTVSITSTCFIDDLTIIKEGVSIGEGTVIHSQVFIGKNVQIGNHCTIYPGVKIYDGSIIGDHCILHSNTVIGSDGFGFVPNKEGVYQKVVHNGIVEIENHVEIGANTVIDRATMGRTVIGEGTKLDNLIQIAHNVKIGNHTVIAAQSGVAGSTQIGSHSMIGGQVGIAGHLRIGDYVKLQAQSGVNKSLEAHGSYYGSPALNYVDFLRSYNVFRKLPLLEKRITKLENNA